MLCKEFPNPTITHWTIHPNFFIVTCGNSVVSLELGVHVSINQLAGTCDMIVGLFWFHMHSSNVCYIIYSIYFSKESCICKKRDATIKTGFTCRESNSLSQMRENKILSYTNTWYQFSPIKQSEINQVSKMIIFI